MLEDLKNLVKEYRERQKGFECMTGQDIREADTYERVADALEELIKKHEK